MDQGRPALPTHLFHALRSEQAGSLLATLLPQLAVAAALGFLLFAMIGADGFQQLREVMGKLQETAEAGGQPDPELMLGLPVGRLFLWMLMLFAGAIVVSLVTFVAVPDIVFGGSRGFAAMRNSLRACVHNLLAMLVFYVLLFIAFFMMSIGIQLLSMTVQLVAGQTAAMWVSNLLLMAVLMPVTGGRGVLRLAADAGRRCGGGPGRADAPRSLKLQERPMGAMLSGQIAEIHPKARAMGRSYVDSFASRGVTHFDATIPASYSRYIGRASISCETTSGGVIIAASTKIPTSA